jgi:uncharacterized protein (DUF1499 family)
MRVAAMLLATSLACLPCVVGATSPFGRLFAGEAPPGLGLSAGRLADCPARPNCVSSTAADPEHFVDPLRHAGAATAAMLLLVEVVRREPGAAVVTQRPDYLYAEFASAVFGFVDDVEFHAAGDGRIDVRSASRLGYSDFGANRRRVEKLRAAFTAAGGARQP